MKELKPIELDGRTGEGGGQLVRIAVALASVISHPIRITHIRGNRPGPRGGGLKSQHVSSIEWLAAATNATVSGLEIGSNTLEFRPRRKPSELTDRKIRIDAASNAASTLLIFQAIFPFLLFAGNAAGDPIELELSGGTNVSFSLSYEYLDQVLLPVLEDRFGIAVERNLRGRGWSLGGTSRGTLLLKFTPLRLGETLRLKDAERKYTVADFDIQSIDVTLLVPADMLDPLTRTLARSLETLFPNADVIFKVAEDSGKDSRVYMLLVARSPTLRWGRDLLTSVPKKAKDRGTVCEQFSRKVTKELYEEVQKHGVVDEFLQDQMVVFQALADGRTSFPRSDEESATLEDAVTKLEVYEGNEGLQKAKKTSEPFGVGSMHTVTARWVTTELMSKVKWYNDGCVCDGEGVKMEAPVAEGSTGP